MDTCVAKYAEEVSKLARIVREKSKGDGEVAEMCDILSVVRKEDPAKIIEHSCQMIWDHREYIAKGDMAYFLNKDYTEDIKKYSPMPEISEFSGIIPLINKMKRVYNSLERPEQNVVISSFKIMLRLCAMYIKLVKG